MLELERPRSKQSIPRHLFLPDDTTLLPLVKVRLPHGKAVYLHADSGAYIIATERWQENITDCWDAQAWNGQCISDERIAKWNDLLAQANLLRRTQLPGNQLCFGPSKVNLIIVELTENCNLACDYCYASAGGKTSISLETLGKAAEVFFGNEHCAPHLYVHFSGGEPLARFSHLLAAIDCMREKATHQDADVFFRLQTNGTLLTPRKAQLLAEQGVTIGVTVETIDPHVPMRRRYIGGRSSAEATMRGLSIAKQYGILSRINITIVDLNVRTLPQIVSRLLGDDVRPNLFQFLPVFVGKGGISVFQALQPDMHHLVEAVQESLKIMIDFNRQNPNNHVYELSTVAMMRKMFYERYIPEMCDQSPCGAGRQVLSLDMYGNIYPCDGFNRHPLFRCGNIFAEEVEMIVDATPIRYLQQRNVLAIPECNTCIWRAYCNAGCPHDNPMNESYSNFGQLFTKSYLCEYYALMIPYIFDLIAEGLDPYLLMPSETELNIIR